MPAIKEKKITTKKKPASAKSFGVAKDYMQLGQKLGLIDTERAGKVAGARFGYLKRELPESMASQSFTCITTLS